MDRVPTTIQTPTSRLQRTALDLADKGYFIGGPPKHFHSVGANQLATLLALGLMPQHNVLDVGCGCLRGGYWLIQFLKKGRYFGIEPNRDMLQLGLDHILPAPTRKSREPKFDYNDRFDFGVFGVKFDFVVARSIWSHAAPAQIEAMLDSFATHAAPNGVFLTSYRPTEDPAEHYTGTEWKGESHQSDDKGMVSYLRRWIDEICADRDLKATEVTPAFLRQEWLIVQRR